jgi:predicted ArsR family transcriptional regulator
MELAILELLERHQALAYEQITAVLHERPYGVRAALRGLCEQGLVELVVTDEGKGASTSGVTRWRVTDAGRQELTHWHGGLSAGC